MAPWLSPAAPKRVSGELRVSDGAETASSVAGVYCLITPDALLTRWYPANFLRWGNRIFTSLPLSLLLWSSTRCIDPFVLLKEYRRVFSYHKVKEQPKLLLAINGKK